MKAASASFRGLLGRWVERRERATWIELFNASLGHPLAYLHPAAWAPLTGASRRLLVRPAQAAPLAAQHLWADLEARRGGVVAPLDYALRQSPLWQLVMCLTRREMLTLALWCGASVVRRRVAAGVDRRSAGRWRSRLGEGLYADVLASSCVLGQCTPLPEARELASGRLLLDLGLALLLSWSADAQGWAARRIEAAAGPHRRPLPHYLGPDALKPAPAAAVEPLLMAFVGRHCNGK